MVPKPRIARDVPKSERKVRDGMSALHLARIRLLPCCVCGKPAPSDPHHLMRVEAGARGMGLRTADKWAIPLCRRHHDWIQAGEEEEKLAAEGIDGRALARSLWANAGNQQAMERAVLHMRQEAALKLATAR